MKKSLLFLLCLSVLMVQSCREKDESTETDTRPYVILVSFDGFRHDYVEKYNAPNFKAFINKGSSAEAMTPSFPSKTFPNHYTIVTGMYPGNHGLVDNTFFDPGRNTTYRIGSRELVEDPYYYDGLPLWQLAQQHNMKSASYFWVGSEADIAGSFPDYYEIYDGAVPNESRIDTVIDWLQLPKSERPQFITLYFSLLDDAGHRFGPNAPETRQAVLEADRLLGLLMQGVESSPLNINVIVTADHGMIEVENNQDTFIFSEDIFEGIDPEDYRYQGNGTHGHIYIEDRDFFNDAFDIIKAREDRFTVYRKEETPEHWHYRDSDRIGDLLIVAETGHRLSSRARQSSNPETRSVWGDHGYDPYITAEMGAIFVAQGPNIKQGIELSAFENIHVFPFITEILGISPPNGIDGDLSVLEPIIKK